MKILSAVAGLVVGLAVPGLAAEDFTSTKEVRLIHGDLGSPKAKTVVIADKAKIEKLVATIRLEKKCPAPAITSSMPSSSRPRARSPCRSATTASTLAIAPTRCRPSSTGGNRLASTKDVSPERRDLDEGNRSL